MSRQQPATSSGSLTTVSTTVIPSNAAASQLLSGMLMTVNLIAGSGAAATMSVYDGLSSSGLLLATLAAAQGTTNTLQLANGVAFANGLTVAISGTAATGVVHYILGS